MANQRKIIGKIPVYRGNWSSSNAPYHKLNDVTLYGCMFRSKIENNSYQPATIGAGGELVVNENWYLVTSGYESEAIKEDLAFIDNNTNAYNVSRFHSHTGFWEAIEYDESQPAYMEAQQYSAGSKVNLVNYTNHTFVAMKSLTGVQPDINTVTNKFTLEEAVLLVPKKYQLSGIEIGFISSETNKPVFHRYNGGTFTSVDSWTGDTVEKLTELEGKLETNFIVTDIPLDKVVISNFIPNAVIQEDRVIISEDFSNFKVLTIDNQTASNKYLYANFETIGSPYNYFRNILIEKGEEKYISTTLVGWNCVVVPAGYKVTIGLESANNDVYQVNTFYKNKEEYENGFLKQNIGLYKKDYYIYNTPRVKKEVTNYQENTVIQDGKIVTDSGFSNFKVYEAVATNSSIYINANFEPINQNNYDYFSNFMLLDADDNIVYLTSITGDKSIVVPKGYKGYLGVKVAGVVYEVEDFFTDDYKLTQLNKIYKNYSDFLLLGKIQFEGANDVSNNAVWSCLEIPNVKAGEIYILVDDGLKRNTQFYYNTNTKLWETLSVSSDNKIIVPDNAGELHINYENGNDISTYKNAYFHKSTDLIPLDKLTEKVDALSNKIDELSYIDSIVLSAENLTIERGNARWTNNIVQLTDEDFDANTMLAGENGSTQTNVGFAYKTTKLILNDSTTPNILLLEADFEGGQQKYFKQAAYYKDGVCIKTYCLTGYKAIPIPNGYGVKITVKDNCVVYKGKSGLTSQKITKRRKPVLWVGTSIPQNLLYPEISCWNNGMVCYNNAIGSSKLCFDVDRRASSSLNDDNMAGGEGKYLTATVTELTETYAGSSLSDEAKQTIYGYSWENLIKPYIDGTIDACELIVIDHGRNDMRDGITTTLNEIKDKTIDWNSLDRNKFHGAFNYLVQEIHKINPFVRIVVGGYFQNSVIDTGNEICQVQEYIAEHYSFTLFDAWRKMGISNLYVPNSSNYLGTINTEYGKDFTKMEEYTDENGNITYFQLYCPDKVHPHSDPTGHSARLFNAIYTKFMADMINHNDTY